MTGSRICYDDDYGAMLIEASESNINLQFINLAGAVIDTLKIVRIIESAENVEQRLTDGAMYINSSDLELGNDLAGWGVQSVGLRFQNVAIPQSATITAAHIVFETDETNGEASSVTFHGEAADNADPFGTSDYDLTNRTLTAADVDWNNIPAWNTVNEKHQSPDMSVIVQEIIDRPGWSANNSMVFVISGTGRRVAEAYDGEAAAAQLLHVEYYDVLVYTPVTPCRIVDTRKAGGAISAGGIRSYNVRGAVGSQGGNPAGCPSPKGEPRAVHVNVTSVTLGNGWITAYPYNSTAPTASIVNYRSDAQNVANSGTIKTCFNCAKDINIKIGGGTTHAIIDVLGYYYAAPQ